MDINSIYTTSTTAITDAANEILENEILWRIKPWITKDILDL